LPEVGEGVNGARCDLIDELAEKLHSVEQQTPAAVASRDNQLPPTGSGPTAIARGRNGKTLFSLSRAQIDF